MREPSKRDEPTAYVDPGPTMTTGGTGKRDSYTMIEHIRATERERCAKCVPTNWLDSLLTGDGVSRPPLTERGIEVLLRGIQGRIRNLAD